MSTDIFTNRYHSVYEVADRFGVAYRTVLREIDRGRLNAVRIGQQYRVSDHDLQSYIDKTQNSRLSTGV